MNALVFIICVQCAVIGGAVLYSDVKAAWQCRDTGTIITHPFGNECDESKVQEGE